MIKNLLSAFAFLLLTLPAVAQHGQSHFEGQLPKSDTVFVGSKLRTELNSGLFNFNADTTVWSTWTGWALSSMRDTITGDFTNDFSSISGSGVNHSTSYGVAFSTPNITMDAPMTVTGTYINNTTYAYKVIRDGNSFSKKFGGDTGSDPDSFMVRATGYLNGTMASSSDFYLADFTPTDDKKDHIVKDYEWWDLSALGTIDSLSFSFYSSDRGEFGINTPTYFCIDNFNGVAPDSTVGKIHFDRMDLGNDGYLNGSDGLGGFYSNGAFFYNRYNFSWMSWSGFSLSNKTDTTTPGFMNQYSSFAGSGFNKSDNYITANGFGPMVIELPYHTNGHLIEGVHLTNATYTALSMKRGDNFAKKFGGDTGNDEDWYKVDIIGFDSKGEVTDTVEFYLADYRFSDNSMDYIVQDWTWVDLSGLGSLTRIELSLSSSDVNQNGMNTPAYVCMDGFNTADPVNVYAPTKAQVRLYPNPATTQLSLQLPSNAAVSQIEIFDMKGSSVLQSPSVSTLKVAELPKGQYTLRVSTTNEVYHAPFVKL